VSEITAHRAISWHRIQAMVLRYWYLLMSSWPRLLELIYWPALQIITWGFLQSYISQNDGFFARAGGTLIGAVILWDILFRGQLGFSISFLEEMWARNLGNLMMSPLKPIEFLISLMIMSLIRLAIGVIPMTLLALFFFDFNFFAIGLPLIAFFCNLIFTSWSVGIFVSGARLHLLSGRRAARLAAGHRLDAAADLCVRGHARASDRSRVSGRPDGLVAWHQRGAVRCLLCDLPCPFAQRQTPRIFAWGWRISHRFPWISGDIGLFGRWT
jgi:hypothetical protein